MGDPKLPRRMWKKPKQPLNYDLKMEELKTLGTFGLKTKRELWKARTELSRVRHQARSLLALSKENREFKEPILMKSLSKIGLVENDSTLDDVLNLKVTDLLSRRLQTVVFKKLFFKTPYQARQAVVHGHIMIDDRVVTIPSYVLKVDEESKVHLTPESNLKNFIGEKEQVSSDLGGEPVEASDIQPTEPKVENKPAEEKTLDDTKVKEVTEQSKD
jgi:small subunit ribosomal protein S4